MVQLLSLVVKLLRFALWTSVNNICSVIRLGCILICMPAISLQVLFGLVEYHPITHAVMLACLWYVFAAIRSFTE